MKILLAAGADVNHRDNNGEVPLMFAACKNVPGIIRVLVAAGASLDYQLHGYTALMCAVDRGHLEAVKALRDLGADKFRTTDRGMTALQLAKQHGNSLIVKVLKKR